MISAAKPAAGEAELNTTSPSRKLTTTIPPPVGIVREDHDPAVVDVDGDEVTVVLDGDEALLVDVTVVVSVVPGSLADVVAALEVVVGPELTIESGVVAKGAAI